MEGKIAVIRLKGENKITYRVEHALQTLKLYRRNGCSIVPNTPSFLGMVKKVNDFVTWGEIDEETLNLLNTRKKKEGDEKGIIHFKLNSPKKGHGRKGLKSSFKRGGAMGYRGEEINELIKRMAY